jgi:5'-methylthioadenosine phosphorylase
MMGGATVVGIFGGSGLYDLDGLSDVREETVSTPFGAPSGPVVTGKIVDGAGEVRLLFLARHGRGHRLLPSEINYRANVHALKQLGATKVLSVSAVGSLREGLMPGDMVVIDQLIDRTHRRESTFFGDGVAGHVSYGDPVCAALSGAVYATALAVGLEAGRVEDRAGTGVVGRARRVYRGGTYVCMEGPQFSTRAESMLHRSWGADIIGMTAATEAKLCREAELCFSSLALVTDYDCWHPEETAVSASSVIEVLLANVSRAKDIVRRVLPSLAQAQLPPCGCASAAAHAIMTSPESIPAAARERLRVLYGRYL